MKILCILFLFSLALFTGTSSQAVDDALVKPVPSIAAAATTLMAPIEKAERELDKIYVKFQNPLRDVNINLQNYSNLLAVFNEFKTYDIAFTQGLLNKVKNQDTLTGTELFVLRRAITTYYRINKKILDFSKVYDFGGFKMSRTFANEDKNLPLIKAHLIWLSGHLFVIDHLETMHNLLYEKDNTFRRIVKNALLDKSNSAEGTIKTLNDIIKLNQYTVEIGEGNKFSQQINLVLLIQKDIKEILTSELPLISIVDGIVNNETAKKVARGKTEFKLAEFTFTDSVVEAVNTLTGWLSRFFGNVAGAIKWRKGYLYKNETGTLIALESLKPMDILLEKSPFILTDKFIPGHYGHVAVYLGTKEQLLSIGMWNHPDIIPYQGDIAAGRVILEAVRSGVRLNTLEDFLNIDELTIVRKEDVLTSETLLIEQIARGMDQIGKAYDFNFDVSTLDKIVCSELIYIMYGNVHWPTNYRFGRATITPDDLAEILFYKNTKFRIMKFMVSKDKHRIDLVTQDYIVDDLNYELRKEDGSPIESKEDPKNTYWKKEQKCYTVANSNSTYGVATESDLNEARACKTSYKEFYYEEKATL
jgi:hypothetical protein